VVSITYAVLQISAMENLGASIDAEPVAFEESTAAVPPTAEIQQATTGLGQSAPTTIESTNTTSTAATSAAPTGSAATGSVVSEVHTSDSVSSKVSHSLYFIKLWKLIVLSFLRLSSVCSKGISTT
jgi:hypothetical protein